MKVRCLLDPTIMSTETTSVAIQHQTKWTYSLGAVAAVLVTSVALVARLKVRSRNKESERKESEEASKHCDE